jgi:ribosome-binding factor A
MTVTKVKISDDLQNAKVFVSFLKPEKEIEELIRLIEVRMSSIRFYLGKKLSTKYVPKLKFFHDDTLINAERIDSLIKKIHIDK